MISKFLVLVAATGLLAASATVASDSDYSQTLVKLVAQHKNAARDADLELSIVEQLEALADANPDEWLPQYWATYFLTQVVMSHAESRIDRLDRAQALLDQATARASLTESYPKGDLQSLQSLIYDFSISSADNEQQANDLTEKRNAARLLAFTSNPESPVVMVMAATDVISAGQKNHSWPEVMAGFALLREAQLKFSLVDAPKGLTTNFNSEWITPWLNWGDRMFADGLDAD